MLQSVKLVGIGATTAGRKGAPSTWISRNGFCKLHPHPSPVIAPTIPHTWDVLYLRSDVTTFSVFVYDEEQDILGFEVGYSDGTSSSLGLCDDTLGKLVKLTLCLSLEEACLSTLDDDNIRSIRIGESRTSDSLAIEVSSNILSPHLDLRLRAQALDHQSCIRDRNNRRESGGTFQPSNRYGLRI